MAVRGLNIERVILDLLDLSLIVYVALVVMVLSVMMGVGNQRDLTMTQHLFTVYSSDVLI